jgi:para-aminobenzoate synthetase component 1
LVSDVVGELKDEVTWREILERLAPAGSISGAPKSSALEVIKRFEPYRGAYCGTLGWIHDGEAHFSVLIRTFFKDFKRSSAITFFGTGAGVTWGSEPIDEWRETELKAERLISLASDRKVETIA